MLVMLRKRERAGRGHLDELLEGVAGGLAVLQLGGQLLGLRLQPGGRLRAGLPRLLQLRQQLLQRRPGLPLLPQALVRLQQHPDHIDSAASQNRARRSGLSCKRQHSHMLLTNHQDTH